MVNQVHHGSNLGICFKHVIGSVAHKSDSDWLAVQHDLFKVVPGGYHRYFFGVKVKTVKLIGGTRFLAARSGLNLGT